MYIYIYTCIYILYIFLCISASLPEVREAEAEAKVVCVCVCVCVCVYGDYLSVCLPPYRERETAREREKERDLVPAVLRSPSQDQTAGMHQSQKRPTIEANETYYRGKRDLRC